MRLVSKINDYYDGAIRTSVSDRTFVFVRKPREIGVKSIHAPHVDYRRDKIHCTINGGVVGFCGEIYPFVSVTDHVDHRDIITNPVKYYYDLDSLAKDFPIQDITKAKYSWANKKYIRKFTRWFEQGIVKTYEYGVEEYNVLNDSNLKNIFIDERVAYFIIEPHEGRNRKIYYKDEDNGRRQRHNVGLYHRLQDVGFYKKRDPYTAFQAIEMFLTNVLVKPDEIDPAIQATITDKLKVQSKGFDKWSFRKMKEDKK